MNIADPLAPTRRTLLIRLKNWQDQESWKDFFDTYWKLIYNAALKAGLNEEEAQDAVQETVVSVMKKMPTFEYDEARGSFKAWLLRLTSWRIGDQFRKRQRGIHHSSPEPRTSTQTSTVERLADPAGSKLEAIWDAEWETNLLEAAIERTKKKVDAKAYQIFDLYVFKQWPVSKVSTTLKVNPARVYMARHRIGRVIRKEIDYLQTKAF